MTSKLLVFGGNGFLGRRICQQAVNCGWEVVSMSRSGKPPALPSPRDRQWIQKVKWEAADILNPSTYQKHFKGAAGVVHSLGILLEDESYKKQLRQELGPSKSTSYSWASWLPSFGPNPLIKKDPNFTYETMNKQSAIILARAFAESIDPSETARKDMPTFTYISADKGFPLIPEGYITSKRQAEEELMRYTDVFRPILVRPGFLFDETKTTIDPRTYIHNALELLNCGNKALLGNKFGCVNSLIRPTVSTQQVSRCILAKIEDPGFEGIVPLEVIKKA